MPAGGPGPPNVRSERMQAHRRPMMVFELASAVVSRSGKAAQPLRAIPVADARSVLPGLDARCAVDDKVHLAGVEVSNAEMVKLRLPPSTAGAA